MCGRYHLDKATVEEAGKLVKEEGFGIEEDRDIFPSQPAPVLVPKENKKEEFCFRQQLWGFQGFSETSKKQVIFNARSETALEKKLFRESVMKRRCIVFAAWFYEWDKQKNKVTFYREDQDILFFAGFFRQYSDGERFVLLTTAANPSMQNVHDRMPLILERKDLNQWLFGQSDFSEILKKVPCPLKARKEYEQQKLMLV